MYVLMCTACNQICNSTFACSWCHNGPGDPSMIVMHMQINVLSSIKHAQQQPDQQQPWGWQGKNTRKLHSFLPDINNQVCTMQSALLM